MSWTSSLLVMGLPTLGAFVAWGAALRPWRTVRPLLPLGAEGREARGRLIPLLIFPLTLIIFGLVILLLLLGESVPDMVALPASLAYAVPGFLSGVGIGLIYRRGLPAAVESKQGFGRVLPLAVMPETSAIFGLVASFFLIRVGTSPSGPPTSGAETAWMAAALSMVGGIGGPVGAWLAGSSWDFQTAETWPTKALPKSTRGGMLTIACFTVAMAVLGEWLIVLLLVVYIAGTLAIGVALFLRVRRRRERATKPT